MPYTDSTGMTWPLAVDLPAAKRVRDLVGVNLLTLRVDHLLAELADPIRLCEVLWAIAKPEADAAGVDQDAFLRRMAVDLAPITCGLLEDLADFFRCLGRTEAAIQIRTATRRAKTLPTMTTEQLESLLNQTMDWMLSQARTLTQSSGTTVMNGPGSSESIRTNPA